MCIIINFWHMKIQTPFCAHILLDLIWFSSCNGYTSGLCTCVTKIVASSGNVYLVSSQMRYIHFSDYWQKILIWDLGPEEHRRYLVLNTLYHYFCLHVSVIPLDVELIKVKFMIQVKQHLFFKNINWDTLARQKVRLPDP